MRTSETVPSGILIVSKPRGMTSHDVVDHVRRVTGIRRIGHAGTLDPLAAGLLILLIGAATKRQAEFMAGEKEYIATLRLGAISDTDDAEGKVTEIPSSKFSFDPELRTEGQVPKKSQIEEILQQFTGSIEQVPPAYSAVKVGGVKGYEAARQGTPLALTPRTVTIREIKFLNYKWPKLELSIACSPGTYIRAIARDIGDRLGCGAYLEALIRTRSGQLTIEHAIPLANLSAENWRHHLVRFEDVRYRK